MPPYKRLLDVQVLNSSYPEGSQFEVALWTRKIFSSARSGPGTDGPKHFAPSSVRITCPAYYSMTMALCFSLKEVLHRHGLRL